MRVNISITLQNLEKLDEQASREGLSRSAFISLLIAEQEQKNILEKVVKTALKNGNLRTEKICLGSVEALRIFSGDIK